MSFIVLDSHSALSLPGASLLTGLLEVHASLCLMDMSTSVVHFSPSHSHSLPCLLSSGHLSIHHSVSPGFHLGHLNILLARQEFSWETAHRQSSIKPCSEIHYVKGHGMKKGLKKNALCVIEDVAKWCYFCICLSQKINILQYQSLVVFSKLGIQSKYLFENFFTYTDHYTA